MSESQSITITYDGYVIKTIEAGQIARMPCAGKGMESDVVVSFGTDGYIYYDGVQKQYQAGQVAIMACEGKKMKTDIIVETEQLAGVWLLNVELQELPQGDFSVHGITYTVDGLPIEFNLFDKDGTEFELLDEGGKMYNRYSSTSSSSGSSYMCSFRVSGIVHTGYANVTMAEIGKEENKHVRIVNITTRFIMSNSLALKPLLEWLKANAVKIG